MPRIRSVKPEFWADEAVARLPRDARLLFLGMLNFADDHGRMRGSPLLIRAQVFPYDVDLDVSRLLASLREAGFIQQYEVSEQAYIEIKGFNRHQKIDHPSKPIFPEPPQELPYPREASRDTDEPSRKISLDQGTGIKEQGEEGAACAAAQPTVAVDELEADWPPELLQRVRLALTSTRRSGQMAEGPWRSFLLRAKQFAVPIRTRACEIYLDRACASEGKDEGYLLGIMRNDQPQSVLPMVPAMRRGGVAPISDQARAEHEVEGRKRLSRGTT